MQHRDTRVQIIIVENGKYILIKHIFKREGRTFWAIPGGGREEGETDEEAAIREAEEETGLKVELLPVKFEEVREGDNTIYSYRRKVTFMGYPIAGEATLGYDPEEESQQYYEILDLKWHDFWTDDEDIDEITKKLIEPFREMIRSGDLPELSMRAREFVEGLREMQ